MAPTCASSSRRRLILHCRVLRQQAATALQALPVVQAAMRSLHQPLAQSRSLQLHLQAMARRHRGFCLTTRAWWRCDRFAAKWSHVLLANNAALSVTPSRHA